MQKKYIHNGDFLFSENFNEYVLENSVKQQKKWAAYFERYPDTQTHANKAKEIILGLVSMEDRVSQNEIPDSKLHNQFEETWVKFRGEKSRTVILKTSKNASPLR